MQIRCKYSWGLAVRNTEVKIQHLEGKKKGTRGGSGMDMTSGVTSTGALARCLSQG